MNPSVRITVLFALLGPPIGGIFAVLFSAPSNFAQLMQANEIVVLSVIVLFYPKAMAIGFVPALITGVTYSKMLELPLTLALPLPIRLFLCGLVGWALTAIFHGVVLPFATNDYLLSRWLLLSAAGATASIVCAILAARIMRTK